MSSQLLCYGWFGGVAFGRFLLAASLGAVFDLIPVFCPAFAPSHLTAAGCAGLAG